MRDDIRLMSPSERCAKFQIQDCHICDREDCCDNQNPVIRLQRDLAAMTAELAALRESSKRVDDMLRMASERNQYLTAERYAERTMRVNAQTALGEAMGHLSSMITTERITWEDGAPSAYWQSWTAARDAGNIK